MLNHSFITNWFYYPFPDPEIRRGGHRVVAEHQMALSVVGQRDLGTCIYRTQFAGSHSEETFAGKSTFCHCLIAIQKQEILLFSDHKLIH